MSFKIPKKEIIYPFSVFVVLMIVVVALWKNSLNSNRELIKKDIEVNGQIQSQGFLSSGQKSIIVLENLMERLVMTDGDFFQYLEDDARLILKEDQSFKFVEWIDSSQVIQRIVPLKGNEAVIGADLSKHPRRDEWLRHVRDSSTNLTAWTTLIQGGNAFLIDVPVFFGGKFQGTITAGMDFTTTFDMLATGMDNYAIEIKDDKGTTFYRLNDPSASDFSDDLVYVRSYEVDQDDKQVWTFYLMPRNKEVLAERNKSSSIILIFGILISLLMSLLTYFYQSSRNENLRFRDLNIKLRVANRSLREERTKAEKASKAKTEFVSNMSHEIRTPLNAIMGFIEVLKESKIDSSLMEYLSLMDVSSKKLLLLVNDILEIDKIESGQISFKKDVFSPSEELENIISIYRPSIEAKGLYAKLDIVSDSKTHVIADIGKFGQILTNLLRNALKFTDEG